MISREEAINHLEDLQVFRHEPTETDRVALGMAIETLRKGMPIRPIIRIEEKGFNKGRIYPHCPICDTMPVPHPNVSYCDKCGQAIDWSEL